MEGNYSVKSYAIYTEEQGWKAARFSQLRIPLALGTHLASSLLCWLLPFSTPMPQSCKLLTLQLYSASVPTEGLTRIQDSVSLS